MALAVAALPGAAGVSGPAATQIAARPAPASPPQELGPDDAVPHTDPRTDAREALAGLLAERAAALRAGDPAGWLAAVNPAAVDFRLRQEQLFDSLRRLPLERWSWTVSGASASASQPGGSGTWTGRVLLRYRVAGVDRADVRRASDLTVVRRGGTWLLADERIDGERDLWDLGPVDVVRGRASVVVGHRGAAGLDAYAAQADEAAAAVGDGWQAPPGDRAGRLVVVVPRDGAELAALLGRPDPAGLGDLAAVTATQLGPTRPTARVLVNPDTFPALDRAGRVFVLTHEAAHVVTASAAASALPRWLAEGFADHVAHRAAGVPPERAAAELLARVRAGQVPESLPAPADFAAGSGRVDRAYEGAWLACRAIARRHGERGLLRLYRALSSAPGEDPDAALDRALRRELGSSTRRLVADWRADLIRLADRGASA